MAMPIALPPPVTSSGHLDAWLDGQRILTQHEAAPAPPRCVAEGGALKEHVQPALAPHEARVRSLFSASGHFVGEVTEVGAAAGALRPGARVWGVGALAELHTVAAADQQLQSPDKRELHRRSTPGQLCTLVMNGCFSIPASQPIAAS